MLVFGNWRTRCIREMFHSLDYDDYLHLARGPKTAPWQRIEWFPAEGSERETDRTDKFAWKERAE